MRKSKEKIEIENYKFHHIDIEKCKTCQIFSCEEACFRGIYKVINKKPNPKCIILKEREENCIKCHICTTACKLGAITID